MKQTQENQEIISQIAQAYPRKDGKINWRRAFQEHPEYKDVLGIKTPKDKSNLYRHVLESRKSGKYLSVDLNHGTEGGQVKQKRQYRKYKFQDKKAANPISQLRFCPCCGLSLEAVQMAIELTK